MKKTIFIYTGSRADYGILKNLIKDLKKESFLSIKLVVGGFHYSKKFGFTYKEILKDKIKIDFKSKIKIKNTNSLEILNFISESIKEYSKILNKMKPSIAIILGDRFEAFAFAVACYFLNIKIAHIHGGEVTEGSFDDDIRHSISKLSNYHFVTHEIYKKRLIQLGEQKKNIFNVGSLGVQNFIESKKIQKKILLKKYNIPLDKKLALVTFHPETKSKTNFKRQIQILLSSLNSIKNIYYIFTYNNMDTYGLYFINELKKFNEKNRNSIIFESMGSKLYFSFLKNVDLVIGNSSSGIIEAPSAKTLTLNIGSRQLGRIKAKSVFTCELSKKKIILYIKKLSNLKFTNYKNVYFKKNSKEKMINILKNKIKKKNTEIKKFSDIKF